MQDFEPFPNCGKLKVWSKVEHCTDLLWDWWRLLFWHCHRMPQPFSVDSNLFYLSDSLSETSNTTSSRIFGDIAVFIDLTKKGRWIVGWGYNYFSITESGTTESTFNLTEMGPKFGYYISKDKVWSIIVGYCFQSTADYSSGSTEAEWRGDKSEG
jgi:hypothetical protein